MSIISVKNLTVLYENHTVINKLNFELNSGDFLCVVGSNGSGKSTLLKTILGLIKPNRGKVIFGDNLDSTQIGYIPQDNKITPDFPASVEEVVKSGILNRAHRHFGLSAVHHPLRDPDACVDDPDFYLLCFQRQKDLSFYGNTKPRSVFERGYRFVRVLRFRNGDRRRAGFRRDRQFPDRYVHRNGRFYGGLLVARYGRYAAYRIDPFVLPVGKEVARPRNNATHRSISLQREIIFCIANRRI